MRESRTGCAGANSTIPGRDVHRIEWAIDLSRGRRGECQEPGAGQLVPSPVVT